MFYSKRTGKVNWLGIVIVVLVIVGVVMFVKNINDNLPTETVGVLDYAVGGIDTSTGKYAKAEDSFYTKNFLNFEGLDISLKENANLTYKVFYYDSEKEFISASTTFNGDYTAPSDVEGAKYVKVMVTDINGNVVNALNLLTLADGIVIKVNK